MTQTSTVSAGPLTFGQMSVWRDIDALPRERWHEPNYVTIIRLPPETSAGMIESALVALDTRHEAMRTLFDLGNAKEPRQILMPPLHAIDVSVHCVSAEDVETKADELRRQPFDLQKVRPWRVVALAASPDTGLHVDGDGEVSDPGFDRLTHVLFAKHHIAFDAWAVELLTAEFLNLLRAPSAEWDSRPVHSLAAIADEQRHTDVWAARSDAARRHFGAVYTTIPARFTAVADEQAVLQASLTSTDLYRSATGLAVLLKVSVGTVVITGVVQAVRQYTDSRPMAVGLMSSNRFASRWRDLITSMNQWIPISLPLAPSMTFREQAELIQRKSMGAYRLGIYDVDVISDRELAEQASTASQPTVHVNVISSRAADEKLTEPDEALEIEWERVFSSVGPRCYLRIFVGEKNLVLKLRTNGLPEHVLEGILRGTRDVVTKALQSRELLTATPEGCV
ncbi:hypothetical protein NFC73_06855 [Pseudarthrobacter sp. RMG13]|uniref:Condensation domain-containing protein n=1 Tax=Pseudarthrobacter humi TaxID=2952523 RepID=A0ABT1LLW7_9MICC|nr:hypothetical protein [Pseudarthrobacter humi]MCP8999452.1 hypothetical protein [Pseudarthrobacter humi]